MYNFYIFLPKLIEHDCEVKKKKYNICVQYFPVNRENFYIYNIISVHTDMIKNNLL